MPRRWRWRRRRRMSKWWPRLLWSARLRTLRAGLGFTRLQVVWQLNIWIHDPPQLPCGGPELSDAKLCRGFADRAPSSDAALAPGAPRPTTARDCQATPPGKPAQLVQLVGTCFIKCEVGVCKSYRVFGFCRREHFCIETRLCHCAKLG